MQGRDGWETGYVNYTESCRVQLSAGLFRKSRSAPLLASPAWAPSHGPSLAAAGSFEGPECIDAPNRLPLPAAMNDLVSLSMQSASSGQIAQHRQLAQTRRETPDWNQASLGQQAQLISVQKT